MEQCEDADVGHIRKQKRKVVTKQYATFGNGFAQCKASNTYRAIAYCKPENLGTRAHTIFPLMKPFKTSIKKLLEQKDYQSLRKQLSENPSLSNEGITIPYDFFCRTKAHPLHRICDAVFAGKITDEEAIQFANIFLEFGANMDGDKNKDEGTPILAASSLHAEKLGIFYIENGADIHYTHKNNGASALHWASYCGRDKLVKKLIEVGAEIDKADRNYNST